MSSAKALNAANLESLGAARLAALLIEVTTGDPPARRRLRLELAGSAGATEVARQVTRRLSTIATAKGFIDWQKIKPLLADLEVQRRAILDLIAPADPREALDLCWRLVACAQPVLARTDDSGDRLHTFFQEATHDLAPLAQSAKPDPATLADRTFQVLSTDTHAVTDDLVATLAPHLGPSGLAALRTLTQAWRAKPAPVLPEHERKVLGWVIGKGKLYADDIETSHRLSAAGLVLRRIADALGDVDGYMALLEPDERKVPSVAAKVARRLLAASRPREAWDALEAARPRSPAHPGADEWDQAHVATLDALGRADEAQSFRWQRFESTLDAGFLRAHLRALPDFEDFDAEQRALAHALAHPHVHAALVFLVAWPDLARAARLVLGRRKELDGNRYEVLTPAADALDAAHPLAATLLRRAMIDFALDQSRSARYGHAARHLEDCASLALRIPDFGDIPDHAAYERALRTGHGRKAAFWDAVKALR